MSTDNNTDFQSIFGHIDKLVIVPVTTITEEEVKQALTCLGNKIPVIEPLKLEDTIQTLTLEINKTISAPLPEQKDSIHRYRKIEEMLLIYRLTMRETYKSQTGLAKIVNELTPDRHSAINELSKKISNVIGSEYIMGTHKSMPDLLKKIRTLAIEGIEIKIEASTALCAEKNAKLKQIPLMFLIELSLTVLNTMKMTEEARIIIRGGYENLVNYINDLILGKEEKNNKTPAVQSFFNEIKKQQPRSINKSSKATRPVINNKNKQQNKADGSTNNPQKDRQKKQQKTGNENLNKKSGVYSIFYIDYLIKHGHIGPNNFNNLTNIKIPEDIAKTLSIGGNFTIHKANLGKSIRILEKIAKKLLYKKINKFSFNKQQIVTHLKAYIADIKTLYKKLTFKKDLGLEKLKRFISDNNLIIKNADKNLGICIMTQTWYDDEVKSHLEDGVTYKLITNFDAKTIIDRLVEIIGNDSSLKHLIPNDYELPLFYLMPKIHKNPISSRPIVPNYAWITTKTSKYLHEELWRICKKIDWIVDSSLALIHRLDTLKFDEEPLCYSIDVKSMYTNINTNEGMSVLYKMISKTDIYRKNTLLHLLNWVLRNNYFMYQKNIYRQEVGTAMGSNVAPAYANLFMAYYEELMFTEIGKPLLYTRYLDDILIIVRNEDEFNRFYTHLSKMTPSLSFTYVKRENRLTYLDLDIYPKKIDNHFEIYYSNAEKNNYKLFINPYSPVADSIKFAWITGENIRLLRNCKEKIDFDINMSKFIRKLKKTGIPRSIRKKYICYEFKDRTLIYNKKIKSNELSSTLIIGEHDILEPIFKDFIHKSTQHTNERYTLVSKNYWKLMDEINSLVKENQ